MKFKTHKDILDFINDNVIVFVNKIIQESNHDISAPKFWVSGGVLADMSARVHSKDVDLFFRSESDFDNMYRIMTLLGDLKHSSIMSKGVLFKRDVSIELVSESSTAITYWVKHNDSIAGEIQLIRAYFGEPRDIVKRFDISPVHQWLEMNGDLHYGDYYHPSIKVVGEYNAEIIYRLIKYVDKGYELKTETLTTLIKDMVRSDYKMSTGYGEYSRELLSSDVVVLEHVNIQHLNTEQSYEAYITALTEYINKYGLNALMCGSCWSADIFESFKSLLFSVYALIDKSNVLTIPADIRMLLVSHVSCVDTPEFSSRNPPLIFSGLYDKYPEYFI